MPDAPLVDMEDYASPGRAFARQARMEHIILTLMERSVKRFLATVTTLATKWGAGLSPVAVEDAWREEIDLALKSPLLSAEATVYVHDVMIDSPIPTEVYNTVVTVYRAAAEQHWNEDETRSIVKFSLSPTTPTAQPTAVVLTAAGGPSLKKAVTRVKRAIDAIDVAQDVAQVASLETLKQKAAVAGISYLGQTWWEVTRAQARNAVTGLEGHLTQSILTSFVQTYGDDAKKRWVTRRDKRVRHTHKSANGQTVPIAEAFRIGGAFLMYPGDRSAPVEETANCRCVMVAVLPRQRDAKGRFKASPKRGS